MFMFGMAAEYFMDELKGHAVTWGVKRAESIKESEDYKKIKELYENYEDKKEALIILDAIKDEFNKGRTSVKSEDWQRINDHCIEINEEYKSDYTYTLTCMMYNELHEREEKVKELTEDGYSPIEIREIFWKKGW